MLFFHSPGGNNNMNNQNSTSSLAEREKEFSRLRNYKVSIPALDELNDASMTSGYKSADTSTPKSPRNSSRQRRQEDQERFKTHTITKNDIISGGDSSPCSSSPASIGKKFRENRVLKQIIFLREINGIFLIFLDHSAL